MAGTRGRRTSRVVLIEPLESRQLLSMDHPIGINFNDEAMWDANFDTAVAEAKNLGVTAVRVWMSIQNWDARPNAWDPVPPFVQQSALHGSNYTNSTQALMKRAFELRRAGFAVCVALVPDDGRLPSSTQQVRSLVAHLRDATETPGSTRTLADVVDFWEIGNEPDLQGYWNYPSADRNVRIRAYVDQFLIPAAQTLRVGSDPSRWEKVISAGVSWNVDDLKTLLQHLKDRNALGLIDLAGYHPYGRYDPETGDYQQVTRTTNAVKYARQFGKELAATEWSVRGYTSSTDTAKWARSMDASFRELVLDNFRQIYYFCLVNNYAARGGATSARPGGVLKHDAPSTSIVNASPAVREQWYNTPLIRSQPFHDTFHAWQWGTVSGTVQHLGSSFESVSGRTVYVDVNGNRAMDGSEPRATTDGNGRYTLRYGSREVPGGTHAVRVLTPQGWSSPDEVRQLPLRALNSASNVNFTLQPAGNGGGLGSISGRVFNDLDRDGKLDPNEKGISARTLYVDLDNDKTLDGNEPSAVSDADGRYTIGELAAGYYNVRQLLPSGWTQTTPGSGYGFKVTLSNGQQFVGAVHGSYSGTTTLGSISGRVFHDLDRDGKLDPNERGLAGRTVWIDLDNDKLLDANEPFAVSDADGRYTIGNLVAGFYNVRQLLPSGWTQTTPGSGYGFKVTLASGQRFSGSLHGAVPIT